MFGWHHAEGLITLLVISALFVGVMVFPPRKWWAMVLAVVAFVVALRAREDAVKREPPEV
jgi:hypothetical protein